MAEKLKDPSKPAGYVFPEDVNEDGSATRNDGGKLKSARKNPWYVLATLFGEYEAGTHPSKWDQEVARQNRQGWNAWACEDMEDEDRSALAEKIGLGASELERPIPGIENVLLPRFRARMRDAKAKLPSADETIDFSETYLENPIGFSRYVFAGDADFESATFAGDANFQSAAFTGPASFLSATFAGEAYFQSATFAGDANFQSAAFAGDAYFASAAFTAPAAFQSTTFAGEAYFQSATFAQIALFQSVTFDGSAYFRSATFARPAYFRSAKFARFTFFQYAKFDGSADFHSATFYGKAIFSSAKFRGTTNFGRVSFETYVPEFYAAELYADTTFELPDRVAEQQKHWPPVRGTQDQDVMPANQQKRAYNRLRLFMNQTLQTEEEQFFHRREMACKKELEGPFMFGVYWLYEKLSDYGYSVARPLAGLGGNVLVGWLLFASEFYSRADELGGAEHAGAFGVSFSNVFAFLGLGRVFLREFYQTMSADYGMGLVLFSSLQTILGFIFLFLLGLGLRSRFRLR